MPHAEALTETRRRSAAMLVAALAVGCCIYAVLAHRAYADDFRAFYLASQSLLHHLDPYQNHDALGSAFADPLWPWPDSRFVYPPTALLFFFPLALVSYPASKLAFGMLTALSIAAVLLLLRRRIAAPDWVYIALFFSMPVFMCIDNGQIECLLLLLLLALFLCGDSAVAGGLWGIAVSIKAAPVLVLLWLVYARRWRTLAAGAVTVGCLVLLAYSLWGPLYFREFLQHVTRHAAWNALPVTSHSYPDLKVIAGKAYTPDGVFTWSHEFFGWFQNPLRHLGRFAQLAGLLLVAALTHTLFYSRWGKSASDTTRFLLFLAITPLANPLLWPMGLVVCLPATALLLSTPRHRGLQALLCLGPLFAPRVLLGNANYALWLLAAGACLLLQNATRTQVPAARFARQFE